MKKRIILCLFLLVGLVFFTNNTKVLAKSTLNLREALADEEIEETFKNYKETNDQITIYLFRGKGCGYCRAFLTFLNSITEEYGKYFKLVSYEVWNNQENANLMTEVANYLEQPAGGVPYIIIGDKVFAGYTSSYDDGIKQAITDLYNTSKKKRYDVFEQMKKNPNKNSANTSNISSIIYPLVLTVISTLVIISYINLKFKELKVEINKSNLVEKNNKIDKNKKNK